MLLFIPDDHPDRRGIMSQFPPRCIAEIHNYIRTLPNTSGHYVVRQVEPGFLRGVIVNAPDEAWTRGWSYPHYIPVLTMPWGLCSIPSY